MTIQYNESQDAMRLQNERQLGQEWKEKHWSEAMNLQRSAQQAEQQRGPSRDYGPSR